MRRSSSCIHARNLLMIAIVLLIVRTLVMIAGDQQSEPMLKSAELPPLSRPAMGVPSNSHDVDSLSACVQARSTVLIVGNRPVGTYLCDYFPSAKRLSNGCVLQCPPKAHDNAGRLLGQSPFTCTILNKGSEAQLRTADVVVSHYGPVPKKFSRLEPAITVFYSGESNITEAKRAKESYQAQYDKVISFHTHREWFFTWTNRHLRDFLSIATGAFDWGTPIHWNEKRDAIAIFVSRCKKGKRESIINSLKSAYPVHSFGKCLRTHDVQQEFPECSSVGGGRYPSKLCVLRHYKFVLALDNSREEDYVTEKVYHALLSGAVPLFDGAPNADEYLPGGWESVVRLSEFEGDSGSYNLPQLTLALKEIAANSTSRLTELTQWRKPVLDRFPSDVGNVDDETRTTLSSHWGATFVERLFHEEPTCELCDAARVKKCGG